MDNDIAGKAIYVIKLDSGEASRELKSWQGNLQDSMNKSKESTNSLSAGFNNLRSAVASLATAHFALSGTVSSLRSVTAAYNEYQAAMNGVKAVASATGNDIAASMNGIREIVSSGLISQGDAAAAMKNLQLYGYSVQEATELIKIMADAAVYNRQANYSVSEAVRVTTEGIRMENSVLSDASGVTKNIAKMYEEYAAQLGVTTNNLTQAQKAQAVYNGFLNEGGIFAGNAEGYTQTLAGAQQQLDTAMTQVQQTLGAVFAQFAPIISGIAQWVSENQQLVAGIGLFVGLLTAGGGLVAALNVATKAITAVRTALTTMSIVQKVAIGGFIGLAAAAAAVGSAILVSNALNSMASELEDVADSSDEAVIGVQAIGNQSSSAADKVAKLNRQLEELERDYRRDLKQIAVNHQYNLDKLTEQIEEANVDYRRAIDERMTDFNVTLAKQERSHQETVDELMTQLSFLQRYNNDYNKQKLAQVQFALAKEEELYKRETEAKKAEIELQNAADKEKLDAKLASLQQELDDEREFMQKHRDELNSVRDVILLDEIQSLNERYEAQKRSLNEQILQAGVSGADASNAYQNGWNTAMKELKPKVDSNLYNEGINAGNTFNKGLLQSTGEWMAQGGPVASIWKALLGDERYNRWTSGKGLFYGGWANGGYTGRGAPDEVAGVVHRGEYVVPADQVDQNTGQPKMGVTQNVVINLSGVLATSPSAKRDLAQELQKALGQINQARLQ